VCVCVCVCVQVVAGHEPELTNAFLQQLGRLATTTDAADAVQRVLAGEHQSDAGGAPPPTCVRLRPSVSTESKKLLLASVHI